MDCQFEDDDVLKAVKNTDHAKQQIRGHLALMTTDEKVSLYRAIVALSAKPSEEDHSQVKHSPEALARLIPKLRALKLAIDDMSDDQFGDWVDALPEDEFLEYIALGKEGIWKIFRRSPK